MAVGLYDTVSLFEVLWRLTCGFFFGVCVCVKKRAEFCSEYLKEQELLEELEIFESIILKWISKKWVERCGGLDSVCSEQ